MEPQPPGPVRECGVGRCSRGRCGADPEDPSPCWLLELDLETARAWSEDVLAESCALADIFESVTPSAEVAEVGYHYSAAITAAIDAVSVRVARLQRRPGAVVSLDVFWTLQTLDESRRQLASVLRSGHRWVS